MNQEPDTEKWLANLLSELIRRGLDSDEHVHFHGSPLGGYPAPSREELMVAHLGFTGEFLTEMLGEHLERIITDYGKLEGEKP